MGYYLQAVIGRHETLQAHAADYQSAHLVPLAQDVAMIPVTDDLHEEIGSGRERARFEKLSPQVEQWMERMSANGTIAYVEAAFFGGEGGQSAVVWSDGLQVLGPTHSPEAMNQAFRRLGVVKLDSSDEFDALGLGRHRSTDDWVSCEQ